MHLFQNYKITFESLLSKYDQFYRFAGEPFNKVLLTDFWKLLRHVEKTEWVIKLYIDREIEIEQADLGHVLGVLEQDPNWIEAVKNPMSPFNRLLKIDGLFVTS